jgi:ribonuclease HI
LEGYHLGPCKEVFGVKPYAILKATRRFASSKECNENFTIISVSQSEKLRFKSDCRGPGQAMARVNIQRSHQVAQNRNTLTIRWIPGRSDIVGNEIAGKQAKDVSRNLTAAVKREPNAMYL